MRVAFHDRFRRPHLAHAFPARLALKTRMRHAREHYASGAGVQVGRASYYSGSHTTASGGHVGAATCASRTLPFGTKVLVTNLANAHRMVLTVNDRGPFVGGRIVDVSRGAAGQLGMVGAGVAAVRVEVLARR